MLAEAPTTIEVPASEVRITDVIVTRHGANYGTVEIEGINLRGETPAGFPVIEISGYRIIRAGICGPWANTFRSVDTVEVVSR